MTDLLAPITDEIDPITDIMATITISNIKNSLLIVAYKFLVGLEKILNKNKNCTTIRFGGLIGNNRHHPYYFGIGNYAYVGFGHGSVSGPGSNPSANSYIYNDFYRYDYFQK